MSLESEVPARHPEPAPTTTTTVDTTKHNGHGRLLAKLEAAEDALERALNDLHRIAASPALNADDDDDDDDDDQTWEPPRSARRCGHQLESVIEDLDDALDSLQLGLGRPYVWLLTR
jgi:hypothetical protein